MNELKSIKELYKPIQPTIRIGNGTIYSEIKPSEQVSNFIYCYWQLKTENPLSENFIYKVVTDGCMDIFWEANKPNHNFITGFSNQYTEFSLENKFNYFGIRFLPTAFPALFKTDASELTNKFEDLYSVIPNLSRQLSQQTDGISSISNLKPILDIYFNQQINSKTFKFDNRIFGAIEIILKSHGTLSIEKDIDVGISSRQLRRLFNFYIGDTPKVFSKVVRFQSLLNGKPSTQSLRENKLYFDLGYYDQTHFIKEFKHLYGSTPAKAFK